MTRITVIVSAWLPAPALGIGLMTPTASSADGWQICKDHPYAQ